MLKQLLHRSLRHFGLDIRRISPSSEFSGIPDFELYQPLFSPWASRSNDFYRLYSAASPTSLVSADRCYVLYSLLKQCATIAGDVWECGVYKGGTAALIARFLDEIHSSKKLYLFDTFEGMPETDSARDLHREGDFSDTSLESVRSFVGHENLCVFKKGFIPESFQGLESASIALAHIDVDIYKSILDSLDFIWPRLTVGGFILFDDYGFATCPGARKAVDEFFKDTPFFPLVLPTGQALVFKGHHE